jgi:predicted dehydrogenase
MALGEVVGVYDDNEQRRNDFCNKYNVKPIETFEELLSGDAEGVIVATATNAHVDVMVKLANAGKHIFTEKVLALTDEGAAQIAEAVKRNGVTFVISLPWKYSAPQIAVHEIVKSGELGKVNYLRFRNCHSGSLDGWLPAHFYSQEECGGGAMIDLGAHGMYLTDWICGVPVTATSVFTKSDATPLNVDGVEDNAVTVMGFADGCIAINETGFVSRGYPASLEVGGEKGYVRADNNGVVKATAETGYKTVSVEVGERQTSPIDQFLTGNILPGCGIEEALRLTHLMVMAYNNCK